MNNTGFVDFVSFVDYMKEHYEKFGFFPAAYKNDNGDVIELEELTDQICIVLGWE